MSASKMPRSQRANPQLGEFLVGEEEQQATRGLISEEDFTARRQKFSTNRNDGSERKVYKDMTDEERFDFLYTTGQQTQRDLLQNSIRLYGIKRNDAMGDSPTEILKRVCKEGLNLDAEKVELISTSALRFIQRVEGGKCIVFQLNRTDLVRKIFEKIGSLRDFQNPWNKNVKIAITRNLCPENNRIRSECLSVKELLKEKGFKDVKIRFNKIISVNGGDWRDYNWYLEHKFSEASAKEERIKNREKADIDREGESESGGKRERKRKNKERDDEESSASSSGSEDQQSGSRRKKSKEWPSLHSKPKERPSSNKKSKK